MAFYNSKNEESRWLFMKVNFGDYFNNFDEEFEIHKKLLEVCNELNLKYKYIQNKIILFDCNSIKLAEISSIKDQILDNICSKLKADLELYIKSITSMIRERRLEITIPQIILPENNKLYEILEVYNCEVDKEGIFILETDESQLFQIELGDFDLQEIIYVNVVSDIENCIRDKFLENIREINIQHFLKAEILFSIQISVDNEHDLLELLPISEKIIIYEHNNENSFLEEIDYNLRCHSDNHLIHNMRKKYIITGEYISTGVGLFMCGYMQVREYELEVTIKAFEYEVLNGILAFLQEKNRIIKYYGNVNWQRLMSRRYSSGYRETQRHIARNEIAEKFLKESKKELFNNHFKYMMPKLLKVGYMKENEYLKSLKNDKEESILGISNEPSLSKFFIEYLRIDKNKFNDESFWLSPSAGAVYREKKQATDDKRIYLMDCEKIYAPQEHLLHYIRTFWHQDFVNEIFLTIKKNWETQNYKLQIIEIIPDLQFDFLNENPKESTKDIDVLLRIQDTSNNREFIIGVEAKRDAKKYKEEKKQIPPKIEDYASTFSGFIFVGYFDNLGKQDRIALAQDDEQVIKWKKHSISRPFLFCASTSFVKLVKEVEELLLSICNSLGEDQ